MTRAARVWIGVLAVLGLLAGQQLLRYLLGEAPPGVSAPAPSVLAVGAASTPPFGPERGAPQDLPALPDGVVALKQRYAALHDRAARFALMKDRPEPEAQYLAWRAYADCAGPLAAPLATRDELATRMGVQLSRQRVGVQQDRALLLKSAVEACKGFLPPNADHSGAAREALKAAAQAGHAAALVAAEPYGAGASNQRALGLAQRVLASRDPAALAAGASWVMHAYAQCAPDSEQLRMYVLSRALTLVACRMGECGTHVTGASMPQCLTPGACTSLSFEDGLLAELQPEQREEVLQVAQVWGERFARGDASVLPQSCR